MAEVGVVVAARNQGRWLGAAIESVRAQTFADWELVVVDDGSTDDTRAVVARFADDRRVRYLYQEHAERSVARNCGIAATDAPLVAFLDGDDLWRPTKLARQVDALRAVPDAGLCYTMARFIDANDRPLDLRKPVRSLAGDAFARLMRGNDLILASVAVPRACLQRLGGFDETLPRFGGCEDWDLWLRIARHHPFVAVDEELTLYRRHPGNTGWRAVLDGALATIDKWYADPTTAAAAGLSRGAVRARHFWANAAALAPDEPGAALTLAARALLAAPTTAITRTAAATLAGLVLPRRATARLRAAANRA